MILLRYEGDTVAIPERYSIGYLGEWTRLLHCKPVEAACAGGVVARFCVRGSSMAAVACVGTVGAATAVQSRASFSGSCSVGASQSVAFRDAAVAVKPLRVCRRGRPDDGVEFLQRKMGRLSVKASAEDGEGEVALNRPKGSGKKKKLVIAAPKKQRVLLRFFWLEKNIGIALDQVVPGHGTIPLSPYFFWPRKDAWEQLKAQLDSKGWISRKRTIILLNQATDIINLWQQNAANL